MFFCKYRLYFRYAITFCYFKSKTDIYPEDNDFIGMNSEFGTLYSIEHERAPGCFIDKQCQNPSSKWRNVCRHHISLQNVCQVSRLWLS